MPMQWNAENDRTFFLKIIETHGITVDYRRISAAWPAEASDKPTPKALSERFRRLKDMTGSSGSASRPVATGTPFRPRAAPVPKTPKSSAKKRKIQAESESDADDHFTEEDTPTGRKSAQRGRAGIGGGIRIKTEAPEHSFDKFNKLHNRASEMRASLDDPFNANMSAPYVYNGSDGFGMGLSMGPGFNSGGYTNGHGHSFGNGMGDTLSTPTLHMKIGDQTSFAVKSPGGQRGPSSRQASQKASAAWKQNVEDESNSVSDEASVSDFQVPNGEDSDYV